MFRWFSRSTSTESELRARVRELEGELRDVRGRYALLTALLEAKARRRRAAKEEVRRER